MAYKSNLNEINLEEPIKKKQTKKNVLVKKKSRETKEQTITNESKKEEQSTPKPTKRKKTKPPEIKKIIEDEFDLFDDDKNYNPNALSEIPKELIDPHAGKHPIEMVWGLNNGQIEETQSATKMYAMKHGMLAGVPLICKDEECSYIDACNIDPIFRRKKGRCPMEVAALISRFEHYCVHFKVGLDNVVDPAEVTDLTLIRQLCDLEIQILRADNKIAIDGDFIVRNLIDETKKSGILIYEDKVSPATSFKMELLKQHSKILQLLAATRKDKVNVLTSDPSVQASIIMKKIKEMEKEDNTINMDLTEDELVNEDGSINFDVINKFAE